MIRPHILCMIVCLVIAATVAADDCDEAKRLTQQALDLLQRRADDAQALPLLTQAIGLCPELASPRSLLAGVYEQQGRLDEALAAYREAARLRPDAGNLWLALGGLHERMGQAPLALDAYLSACLTEPEARARIAALLDDDRYQTASDGAILSQDSLRLLFDRDRRADLNERLTACRMRSGDDALATRGVGVKPAVNFPNLLFDLGQAALQPGSRPQIDEIAAALREFQNVRVLVNGHTDQTPFRGVTDPAENRRRNLQLSHDRAETVKTELTRRGLAPDSIATAGYGPDRPVVTADTHPLNRRVEIVVQ
jgi:outer membrane protein OmpA-like peptidoglycan-associated protein